MSLPARSVGCGFKIIQSATSPLLTSAPSTNSPSTPSTSGAENWRVTRPGRSILRAHWVIGVIQRLYDVERLAEGKEHQERRELRQKYSVPLLEELRTWMDGQLFLPKSPTGEAARYTRNQWATLNRYVEDGRLAIDNNAA